MSTLRQRNRQRTLQEIAEAALALFEQHGFEATTVDQIAAAAGVSPATFFRYYASKEDVLFAHADESAAELVVRVRDRQDHRRTLSALQAPIVGFADSLTDGSVPRLTALVMTTRTLEARSLRMPLRWQHDVAFQLAEEAGLPQPGLPETTTAAAAVACLTSALRHWDYRSPTLGGLTAQAFEICRERTG
jgi:AcrR family transcriptional regulator